MSAALTPSHHIVDIDGPSAMDASALLFDPDWYRAEYPDVAISGVDPVRHYFSNGASEARNPNPHFNTRWYETKYPDVVASGMNPFMHFLLYGFREGRQTRENEVVTPISSGRIGSARISPARGKKVRAGGGI